MKNVLYEEMNNVVQVTAEVELAMHELYITPIENKLTEALVNYINKYNFQMIDLEADWDDWDDSGIRLVSYTKDDELKLELRYPISWIANSTPKYRYKTSEGYYSNIDYYYNTYLGWKFTGGKITRDDYYAIYEIIRGILVVEDNLD